MTAREFVKKRTLAAVLTGVVSAILFIASLLVLGSSDVDWLIKCILLIGIIGPGFYVNFGVLCPKCHLPYNADTLGIAFPSLALLPKNYCQSCGANVDDPM